MRRTRRRRRRRKRRERERERERRKSYLSINGRQFVAPKMESNWFLASNWPPHFSSLSLSLFLVVVVVVVVVVVTGFLTGFWRIPAEERRERKRRE